MTRHPSSAARHPFILALLSAALLVASFPSFNQPACAWVALVPWLLLLRSATARAAFRWSWLIGMLFFLGSMWWLLHLTAFGGPAAVLGWVALSAYLALYFGAFGWFVHRRAFSLQPSAFSVFVVPAAWVALEYLRSRLLSGLGWNLLAYSQTPWLSAIQIADVTGAWGVSFVIVLVNAVLADYVGAARDKKTNRQRISRLAVAGGAVLITLGYGHWRLRAAAGTVLPVRLAVVQGNIPQAEKWDEERRDEILEQYGTLTREAARSRADLIVWPETSVPGFLDGDEALTQRVFSLAKAVEVPLLIGSPHAHMEQGDWRITNGAALVHGMRIAQWYDKLHLVPFGEFVPFERQLPWLRHILPPIGEFVPGREDTVFQLGRRPEAGGRRLGQSSLQPSASSLQLPCSVLICFEDLFPDMARRFVQRGARLLLVITNDAWFGPTAAAYQHAQASTLRAVELRVPVARAANTGWSGCIDAAGRWTGSVNTDGGRELFVAGTHTCELSPGTADTLYLRWGDWFALLCLFASAGWLIQARRR